MDKHVQSLNWAEGLIQKRKDLEAEIADYNEKVEAAKVVSDTYQLASDALAPRGGRQLLLDSKLKDVEMYANEVLEQMGSKERITINTQTETGQETLLIMVSSESLRPLETYSGGEQTRISLAIRFGIIKALGGKVPSDVFFMDETLGDQDANYQELISHFLIMISNYVRQLFIISHDPRLIEAADVVLDMSAGAAGSMSDQLINRLEYRCLRCNYAMPCESEHTDFQYKNEYPLTQL